MPFTIGELIILGIVVATLATWRFLDRDNRSLEKVKKLGDRLQGELGAYVDRRVEDLKQYAIDLDVRNKSAKEVLKRLQGVEEELNGRAADMAAIGKRIAEYDEALARLMDMSARVDENLARIQSESEFTDGVAKKIDAASRSLAAVESSVALLRDDFARDNLAALETVRDGLFTDTETKVADIRELLVKAQADAELSVSNAAAAKRDAEREFAKAFERARTEAEKLEDAAFEKLRQAGEAKAAKLKETVEDKFAQIGQLAKDRASETQTLVRGFKAEWKAEAEELLASFKATLAAESAAAAERAASAMSVVEARILETNTGIAAISSSLDAATARAEALAAEHASSSESRLAAMDKRIGEAVSAAETRIAASDAAIDARLGSAEEAVDQRLAVLAKKADEVALGLGEKLKTLLASQKDDFAQRATDAKAAQAVAIAELKAGVEASKEERAATLADLRAAFDEAQARKAALEAELLSALDGARKGAEELVGRLSKDGEIRSMEVLAAVERRLDDYGSEVEAKFRRLEAVNVDIGVLEGSLRVSMADTGEKIEGEFASWGRAITERQKDFEGGFLRESERLSSSMRSLEEELDSLKSRAYDNVSQKLKVFEDEFFADLRQRKEGADAALAAWKVERDAAFAELGEALSREEESTRAAAEAGLAALGTRLQKDLEEARRRIDERMLKDIDAWKSGLDSLVAKSRADYEQQHEAWAARAIQERESVRRDLEQLTARSKELGEALERKIGEAMGRLDEESSKLAKTVADIDREQKAFVAQTRIFERSDELVAKLSQAIEAMKGELNSVEAKRQELAELEERIGKVRRLEEELGQRIAKFLAEKKRVDTLEEGFARLATVAEGVDRKLADVTGQGDALTEAQARIRRLLELSSEAEAKYDRLEKKGEVIEATVEMVDKNFKTVSDIERSVSSLGAELKRIPDRIAEVERSVAALAAGKERADEAARKLGELDSVLTDAERRIAEAQKVREWLARSETRIEEINRQAEEQLKLLSTLLKEEGGDKRGRGAPPGSVQDTVRKLARQGWSADEIARAVKVSRGEVELILELGSKG